MLTSLSSTLEALGIFNKKTAPIETTPAVFTSDFIPNAIVEHINNGTAGPFTIAEMLNDEIDEAINLHGSLEYNELVDLKAAFLIILNRTSVEDIDSFATDSDLHDLYKKVFLQ